MSEAVGAGRAGTFPDDCASRWAAAGCCGVKASASARGQAHSGFAGAAEGGGVAVRGARELAPAKRGCLEHWKGQSVPQREELQLPFAQEGSSPARSIPG